MITVCVDAMGGDAPADVVLEGIEKALEANDSLQVLVAGTEEVVVPFCQSHDRTEPLVASEVIGMEEHPAEAVRKKRDSSLVLGCRAVKEGRAQGFFSAGSTGAILTAATLHVGRIRGIIRPALAVVFPGLGDHQTLVLDVGANADCRPEMIVQFALMGSLTATLTLGAEECRVGLLSNGSEETKGSETVLAYHEALEEANDPHYIFAGNAEGNDLLLGSFDVIVTDGFTGNVALKSGEGAARFIAAKMKELAVTSLKGTVAGLLAKPMFKEIGSMMSGEGYGGAVLLGLRAPVLVGHGDTNPTAIMNGTLRTMEVAESDLCGRLAEAVSGARAKK